jgi:lipopolysaccharide/colanic/teichoic acid biosynthesis glycosyltransferase/nucleoside-diphosphate-sugar epimerase
MPFSTANFGRNRRPKSLSPSLFLVSSLFEFHEAGDRSWREAPLAMNSTFYSQIGKRWLDVTLSLTFLLLVSPLLLLAALAIRLTSRGPIFFRQLRVGRHAKLFRIFKLRTMIDERAASGSSITAARDPRITAVGKWLRKTKVDELPQLLNVLQGEMSLVGPRPEIPEHSPAYPPDSAASFSEPYQLILRAKPGITGPAAIAYIREEQLLSGRSDKDQFYRVTILPHKVALDLAYCENIRFLEDLKLIAKTTLKLFDPRKQSPPPPFQNHPQEIHPEEFLGRKNVEVADLQVEVGSAYQGKCILVTGAGGSIGSELVRQLIRLKPERIACLDRDENSIYELEQELLLQSILANIEIQVADVRDAARLRAVFSEVRPQIIFHAAAYKHVPLMEKHPCEAILNNVGGTRNVLEVASQFGVESFVFISSDKAVNPAGVMGATKRIGEMLVQTIGASQDFRSACVRFGNVLGTRGSVLPLFKKQIARGGPVTVTHPHAERFFMTIEQAVRLILHAGALAQGGEIFVMDMGHPRNILDLARELILRRARGPAKNIKTTFTGLRPGEKLSEELAAASEILRRTRFENLSVIEPHPIDRPAFMHNLALLEQAAADNNRDQIFTIFGTMELGFNRRAAKVRAATAAD